MPETHRFIEPFSENIFHLVKDFSASEDSDDDYFKRYLFFNGLIDNEQGVAKTYVYLEECGDDKKILGFYSIRCSSLIIGSSDNGERIGEPALEIVELAVHKDYQRNGIGTEMMKKIFSTAYTLKEHYLGVKHLVVCAKDSAKTYYEKFGFRVIPGYQNIPRSYDNQACIGMSVRFAFK
ncbi:MAG: GNAT family N-acetyltransferase [Oscillospiraceae bacterium]|nr:GNAT family N-acetyltransferase [Oscillospiraceae bacterium]